jgi:hypothetical protein
MCGARTFFIHWDEMGSYMLGELCTDCTHQIARKFRTSGRFTPNIAFRGFARRKNENFKFILST